MKTTLNEATRLGLSLNIKQADATDIDAWWQGELYDAVLADVPCSGTGTIRRHPDVRLLLKAEDIERHQKTQVRLLETLWQTVQKNGYLLYSTCSVLKEENDDVIAQFLKDRKDAQIRPFSLPYGHATEFGIQTTPIDGMTDGFYYCALTKHSTASTGASS